MTGAPFLVLLLPWAAHGTVDVTAESLEGGNCYTEAQWRQQELWNFTGAFERCGPSSVCKAGHGCGDFCKADDECEDFPMRVCVGKGRGAQCQHKDLFGEAAGRDVGAAFAFFIISGLALSAGIGGGGLYVPLLMIMLGFTAHEATGLSQALLTGGASSTLVYNMRQRHPSGNKPMIDYDLVLVMGPNLLIGALIGSALNIAAPSWFILVLLTTILSHSAWKTLQKAVKTFKREKAGEVEGMPANDGRLSKNVIERIFAKLRNMLGLHSRLDEKEQPSTPKKSDSKVFGFPAEATKNQLTSPHFAGVMPAPAPTTPVRDIERAASLDHITLFEASPSDCADDDLRSPMMSPVKSPMKSPAKSPVAASPQPANAGQSQPQFPRAQLAQFGCMWLIVILCIIVRGGRASPGLVQYCGQTYWILTAIAMQALALLSFFGVRRAVQRTSESPGDKDTFQWTVAVARKVAMYSLGAGTLAALCGIGGGMVMGPILLDLGVLPQVQSATTATTLLVLSSSSALAFLVQGAAPIDYAIFMAFATASGAVIGKAVVGYLIKLYRRPSAIIFLLGGIILASVIIMATTGTIGVINDIQKGNGLGLKSVCLAASSTSA